VRQVLRRVQARMQRDVASLDALKAEVKELQGGVREREGEVAALRGAASAPGCATSRRSLRVYQLQTPIHPSAVPPDCQSC
jgi:hypothetical protein